MTVRILQGDCRQVLKTLPDDSVHCCVTSPPYWGLRSYLPEGHPNKPLEIGSEPTLQEWVQTMVEVFREVRRVLRPDGTLWLNLGDSYNSGTSKPSAASQTADVGGWTTRSGDAAGAKRVNAPGLKVKDMMGQPWRVAFALQADGWWLRQEIIWCLSGGAAVYARTQKGDMPIMVKDLVRLRPETVKLWNGSKWTQVLGWNRSTDTDGALEIELRSGERIGCTPGHEWPTKRGLLKASELVVGDVIDTTRLPEPETPKVANALGVDVAWLCGLYLAEGSMSGDKVQIAGHTKESAARLERIERVAEAFHGSASVFTSENSASIVIYGPVIASVIRAYIHGNTAQDKGIKVRAWMRSDEWLMAFLQGYLAGDGHYDAANDRWRLGFCRNDRLADDFRTLAARLGLPLRLNATTSTGFGREWPAYRGDIRLVPTTHHNARVGSAIVAIHPSRARQFWDIGVEDDPHTFALASGVLTHNSKPNPMPESTRDRCTKAHEHVFLLSKSERYFYDFDAMQEPVNGGAHARRPMEYSGAKRPGFGHGYDAVPKGRYKTPDGWDTRKGQGGHGSFHAEGLEKGHVPNVGRREGPPGNPAESKYGQLTGQNSDGMNRTKANLNKPSGGTKNNDSMDEALAEIRDTRNPRSVWTIPTFPFKGAHFATFPPALAERCITAGCPVGGVVLDPFGGSGTVGLVADRQHKDAILIDLDERNVPMATERIAGDSPLFAEVKT